jgi:hypothetical protein
MRSTKVLCDWEHKNSLSTELIKSKYIISTGGRGIVVEELCYKPEGRGFETR